MTNPSPRSESQHNRQRHNLSSAMSPFLADHLSTEPLSPRGTPELEETCLLEKPKPIRTVRFLLSPPPEDVMAEPTREILERAAKIVLPTENKEEEVKLSSGSSWGRGHLNTLGVKFVMNSRIDLNRSVLKVKDTDFPPVLRQRIQEGVRQLRSVEMDDLNKDLIDEQDIRKRLAPDFLSTFLSLIKLAEIKESKERAKLEKQFSNPTFSQQTSSQSQSHCQKRPLNSPTAPGAPKRARSTSPPQEPKTPDQPTHPSDPNYTGSSSTSKDEENTRKLLSQFVMNTLVFLEKEFQNIGWQTSGVETITAKNDGGLGLRYNARRGWKNWELSEKRPLLSLEAKRLRSRRKDDPELLYQYAGQVFCEMLGQTCYKEFYTRDDMDYQEAFVLHGSHSSVTIYYAKLPNNYLREIAAHGVKYKQKSTLKLPQIQLRRTKKFHMTYTPERIELFELLAKLLWYLISGRPHVGYLFNYPQNPIHTIGQHVFDSIKVRTEIEADTDEEAEGSASTISEPTDDDYMDLE